MPDLHFSPFTAELRPDLPVLAAVTAPPPDKSCFLLKDTERDTYFLADREGIRRVAEQPQDGEET